MVDSEYFHLRGKKMSKYEAISGPYFPTFGLNTDQK